MLLPYLQEAVSATAAATEQRAGQGKGLQSLPRAHSAPACASRVLAGVVPHHVAASHLAEPAATGCSSSVRLDRKQYGNSLESLIGSFPSCKPGISHWIIVHQLGK